jgi:hypothetical protein
MADHHLGKGVLLDYAEGKLWNQEEKKKAVEAHLIGCETCLKVVTDRLQSQVDEARRHIEMKRKLNTTQKKESEERAVALPLVGIFKEAIIEELRVAKRRSEHYEQTLNAHLEQTRQDISKVDWRTTVPDLIKEALGHVRTSFDFLVQVYRALDEENGSDTETLEERDERYATPFYDLAQEAWDSHSRLHGVLLGARGVFFVEQERQSFRPRGLSETDL